jgi:hypothetical protein
MLVKFAELDAISSHSSRKRRSGFAHPVNTLTPRKTTVIDDSGQTSGGTSVRVRLAMLGVSSSRR